MRIYVVTKNHGVTIDSVHLDRTLAADHIRMLKLAYAVALSEFDTDQLGCLNKTVYPMGWDGEI